MQYSSSKRGTGTDLDDVLSLRFGSSFFENRSKENSGHRYDRLISPKEAAQYLGVKIKFIYERLARREIDFQPIGRLKRIRISTLESWLLREKQRRSNGQSKE